MTTNRHYWFTGVLTVNVSVLLLSLASPDESSLVSCILTKLFTLFIYIPILLFVTFLCCYYIFFLYIHIFLLKFQKYEVEFLLQQQWYDPRLRYSNQSHYEYLNAIHHHEDIWLPDTYFIMHGDFKVSYTFNLISD